MGLWILGLAGCTTDKDVGFAQGDDDSPAESAPETGGDSSALGACPWTAARVEQAWVAGLAADEGFGSAVAWGSDGVWAGAPFGAQGVVYAVADGAATALLQADGRAGSALAVGPDGLVIGAPLTGQVLGPDGAALAEGAGLGLALWGDDAGWVAAGAEGWVDSDGGSGLSLARPGGVARAGGVVALGLPRGSDALLLGEAPVTRVGAHDEAGYALAPGDVAGDGTVAWIVGAPAANAVYLLDAAGGLVRTLSGGGRFGAAVLAVDLDQSGALDLVVGAPMDGDEVLGSVSVYLNGSLDSPALSWTGRSWGANLGAALAGGACGLVAGAPGGAGDAGEILILSAPPR